MAGNVRICNIPCTEMRPCTYGAPEWTKFNMAIDDEIDRRSSMSTVDLRCRPSIFDVDRRSSMSTVDLRCRPSIFDVDRRSSMSTVDLRCRPSIFDVDRRSSMSTVDLRCRPSIFDVDRRSSMSTVDLRCIQYTGSGLVIYPIMVYYWCFDMVPIPCAFKVYQRFTQEINYQ